LQVSAKTGTDVQEAFEMIAHYAFQQRSQEFSESLDTIRLTSEELTKSSGSCGC
jgi:hypothetical protein